MKKLLIVTDLDATFIDENYQYTEATEAIEQLSARGFPLVFNSSKTLAEIKSLAQELKLTTPLIAENGGIVAVPNGSELAPQEWQRGEEYHTLITGLSREYILEHAHAAREENGYSFRGFSDMSDQELSALTGLTEAAAHMAKDRHVSEPILWNDTSEHWHDFAAFLRTKGIRTLSGGRFIHLMGPADKEDGLTVARQLYEIGYPDTDWITVALGDSANDMSMLEAADIAVVIPHPEGPRLQVSGSHVIQAKYPASKGWNDTILKLLTTL